MSSLKLNADSGGGSVALSGPSSTTSNAAIALKLPVADGSANQILKTDGSGQLGWATDNSGISLSGSTNNTIATVTGANALQGEANLTFDGSALEYSAGGSVRFNLAHVSGGDVLIKNPTAAVLAFGTNNAERLRIDSSGRVLIGATSTSPANSYSDNLIVRESAADAGISIIGNNSNSNYASLYLSDGGTFSRSYLEAQLGANGAFTIGTNGTGPMRLVTNNAERLRITSGGGLLIGATSYGGGGAAPALYVSNSGGRQVKIHNTSDSTSSIQLTNSGTGEGDDNGLQIAMLSDSTAWINNVENAAIRFATNGSERIRITEGGKIRINRTTQVNSDAHIALMGNFGSSGCGFEIQHQGNSGSNRDFIRFYNKNDSEAGSIEHSSSTAVSFNTSSDYRLKENIALITDGITKLKLLKPSRFTWKDDPEKGFFDGFIAHEVTPACPNAVSGEKDAERMQSMDYSKLTPLLTAALQEAISKIETLETKVAVLEAT